VRAGDVRAIARAISIVEDARPEAAALLSLLFPHAGKAVVLGVTGPPGSGKSTLVDRMTTQLRGQGKSVGIVAVDPTSPYTGGAILGDRIRMQAHALDEGVFIRSMATRGHLGGLAAATSHVLTILSAAGKDVIIVETVGVGQDEIDIAQMAHSTLVITVPGMGDDIQAIKAGILEVADVFVVNKSDLDGADRTVRELRQMLELRHAVRAPAGNHDAHHRRLKARAEGKPVEPTPGPAEWEPPILKVIAARDQGLEAVVEAIDRHRAFLESTGQRAERERARARMQFLALLRDRLLESALSTLEAQKGRLDEVALAISRREADPYALADTLAHQLKS
jgi:LAO/AO transport system kinase